MWSEVVSFSGLLPIQFLIACYVQKPSHLTTCSAAQPAYVAILPLNNQVMYHTNLSFCASYGDGTSASGELHRNIHQKVVE